MKIKFQWTLFACLTALNAMSTNIPSLRPSNNLNLTFLNPAYSGLNPKLEMNVNSVYSYVTESVMWGTDTRFYLESVDLKTGMANTTRSYDRNMYIQQFALQKQIFKYKDWRIGAALGFSLEKLDRYARGRHLNASLSVLKRMSFGKISMGFRLSRPNYLAKEVNFPETDEGQSYNIKLNSFNTDYGIQFTNNNDRWGLGIAYNNLNEETIDKTFRDTSFRLKFYRTIPSNLSFNFYEKSTLRNHLYLLKSIFINIHPSLNKNYSEMYSLILYKEEENKACFGGGMFFMSSGYGRVLGPIARFQYKGLKMQYNLNIPIGRIIQTISMAHELTLNYVLDMRREFKPIYTPEF